MKVSPAVLVIALCWLIGCRRAPGSNTRGPVDEARAVTNGGSPPAGASPSRAPARRTRLVLASSGERGAKRALWSVSADGKTAEVPFPSAVLAETVGREGAGSDAALPSPDGARVAYVKGGARDGILEIRDLATGIAAVVAPKQPRSEILITGWHSSGRRLLYSIAPLDGPNGVLANPDASALDFFVHDVGTHTTEKVEMPCAFQAWLASGEFLVACHGSAELARVRGRDIVALPKHHERHAQASVAGNGTIVLVVEDGDRGNRLTRVIALDPLHFAETAISTPGTFGEYQFPKASPTGRVAYTHHVPIGGGRYRIDLLVARSTIAQDISDYEWIDDDAVAVMRPGQAPTVVGVR
jgi:hypothetical protein